MKNAINFIIVGLFIINSCTKEINLVFKNPFDITTEYEQSGFTNKAVPVTMRIVPEAFSEYFTYSLTFVVLEGDATITTPNGVFEPSNSLVRDYDEDLLYELAVTSTKTGAVRIRWTIDDDQKQVKSVDTELFFKRNPNPDPLPNPDPNPNSNQPPVAALDEYQGIAATELVLNPLVNDIDPQGDVIQIVRVDPPANGTVYKVDGTYFYISKYDFLGIESISYVIKDSQNNEATGSIQITIREATVAIVDPVFEEALVVRGIDTDGLVNGQMSKQVAEATAGLDLQYREIVNTSDLKVFPNLRGLNLTGNRIQTIDLALVPRVVDLNLSSNPLINLDTSKLPELEALRIDKMFKLTSLNTTGNTRLDWLTIGTNNNIALDLSTNSNLEIVQLLNLNITELNVTALTSLKQLKLEFNQGLKEVNLSNNTNLEYLIIEHSEIASLDLSENRNLNHLLILNTPLTELTTSNNTGLTSLDIKGNFYLERLDLLGLRNTSNSELFYLNVSGNENLSCILV